MHPPENTKEYGYLTYDANNVLDRNASTSWVENASGPGIGESITLRLPTTHIVTRIGMDVGYDRDERIFFRNSRVRRVHLVFSDGTTYTPPDFRDTRGMQSFNIPAIRTETVTVVIDNVYLGDKYPDDTCVAEIELWGYESR